jgi:hypothetical protein
MDEQFPELKEKEHKKAAKSRPKGKTSKEKSLLLMELAEIKEISDKLFERIEKKIEVLRALEASVDEKIVSLKKLGQENTALETLTAGTDQRPAVISLKEKGLSSQKIAATLGMPLGEVELILNLNKDHGHIPDESLTAQQDKITFSKKPHAKKNLSKMLPRKFFWTTISLLLLLGSIIIYFVFLQRTNVPLTPKNVEQPDNVQQQENSGVEKSRAIDLIRQKYSASSNMQTGKQVSPPVQKEPNQIETPAVKEIEQKEIKKIITIVTKTATIRASPSLDSQPVTWVSQGVVFEIKDEFIDDAGKKWYKIVTSGGKKGWLADKVVRELS